MENAKSIVTWWERITKMPKNNGVLTGLFGGFDTVLIVLIACMVMDYVCGLVVVWLGKSPKADSGRLDGKIGVAGIAKKGLMLLAVMMAALLDQALGTDAAVFRNAVTWFYIGNEGLSILENLSLAGVPFPKKLKAALEQLRKQNGAAGDNEKLPGRKI